MISLGIDVGSISVKVAVIGSLSDWQGFREIDMKSPLLSLIRGVDFDRPILISEYRRIKGEPLGSTLNILRDIFGYLPEIDGIRITGVCAQLVGQALNAPVENDFKTAAIGVGTLYPDVRTIFEMGGDNSKYTLLGRDPNGKIGILDYEKNGECAAGTGSFIDQQAVRLKYDIEDVGDIVISAKKNPAIAGRCSVFAKSDMIHAQQKGYTPSEILKGLCDAVVRNFKGSITKGKKIVPKVAFIGGVAANKGVSSAMREIYEFTEEEIFIPEYHAWFSAIGASMIEIENSDRNNVYHIGDLDSLTNSQGSDLPFMNVLSKEKVVLLRDMIKPFSFVGKGLPVDAYMGIDVGSVSTNFAILDSAGNMILEIYERTRSRPIEVISEGLQSIEKTIGDKIIIRGVGTTGSGRELIGKLIGSDIIKDEITSHKTGATFVGQKLINNTPDTIFEIGGQDSKYISIEDDVVVDFTMNEACAAGTGSFLEEQAARMDVNIINEFSHLAFCSANPIRLGERCTVFMEKEINPFLQKGATKEDLCSGLAYSIATNYLNRVVRGRHIGDSVFFQGGTAYNDSVAAAFSTLLDKEIVVPPHNGVIGAIGAALLAKEKVEEFKIPTRFRGFNIGEVKYNLREFTCKGCSNYCDIQQFTVEGDVTYWGDKCSERYRKHVKSEKEPVIPDIISLRDDLLLRDYHPDKGNGTKIGFPRAMYFFDRIPFWLSLFNELGFSVVLSDPTNKRIISSGVDATVAEPCFPIKVAHGHVANLLEKGVDYILLPNIIDSETEFMEVNSHLCPWGQTMTFMIAHSPLMDGKMDMILRPRIHFRDGIENVKDEIYQMTRSLGVSRRRSNRAIDSAYSAMQTFKEEFQKVGRQALNKIDESGELGMVLVGRPYNINDSGVSLDVSKKLRDYYGVNVIPIDALPLDGIDISDVNENMYWNYGKKILQAAKFIKRYPNLHLIYLTNFKCGPDSYIKHFMLNASGKPFLSLQFDEHANDAGIMTRIEAYLDSKGFLRWWARKN
ncbi:MAG: acyl-CoA dehydratase activase [Spirochaetota bacterium]|nr:acyl-CoA dehydratase activase [Spirochaetota bacterium]